MPLVSVCGNICQPSYEFSATQACPLLPGMKHFIRIRAMNEVGWGAFSLVECSLILSCKLENLLEDDNEILS